MSTGPSESALSFPMMDSIPDVELSWLRIHALSSLTVISDSANASMPSASASVGNTRIDVAHRSLTNMSIMEWSMNRLIFRSFPAAGRSGSVQEYMPS